jgi:hypothetical protein
MGNSQYEWVLRNHLGSTRVTFTDGDVDNTKLEDDRYDDGIVTEKHIKQVNNFYAYGMNMKDAL